METNRPLVDNIRLWDYRPLLQTYSQLQSLRPYYVFNGVDLDRYPLAGGEAAGDDLGPRNERRRPAPSRPAPG